MAMQLYVAHRALCDATPFDDSCKLTRLTYCRRLLQYVSHAAANNSCNYLAACSPDGNTTNCIKVASWHVGPLGSATCDKRCGSDRLAAKCSVPERTAINTVLHKVRVSAAAECTAAAAGVSGVKRAPAERCGCGCMRSALAGVQLLLLTAAAAMSLSTVRDIGSCGRFTISMCH